MVSPSSSSSQVLRTPQVPRVLLASLVGRLPFGAAPLALLLFTRESGSIAAAGLIVAAYGAGTALGQPLLSRLAGKVAAGAPTPRPGGPQDQQPGPAGAEATCVPIVIDISLI